MPRGDTPFFLEVWQGKDFKSFVSEVWQRKDLRVNFAEVWQGKDLGEEGESTVNSLELKVEEKEEKYTGETPRAGRGKRRAQRLRREEVSETKRANW